MSYGYCTVAWVTEQVPIRREGGREGEREGRKEGREEGKKERREGERELSNPPTVSRKSFSQFPQNNCSHRKIKISPHGHIAGK